MFLGILKILIVNYGDQKLVTKKFWLLTMVTKKFQLLSSMTWKLKI
jgi:hypothetical protein